MVHRLTVDSPHKGSAMLIFDVFFYVSLNTLLNKQWKLWIAWDTISSMWRHYKTSIKRLQTNNSSSRQQNLNGVKTYKWVMMMWKMKTTAMEIITFIIWKKQNHHLIRFYTKRMGAWSENIHAYQSSVSAHSMNYSHDFGVYILQVLATTLSNHYKWLEKSHLSHSLEGCSRS